jgi:hypothetical protein
LGLHRALIMKKVMKILCVITNSVGEIDVLFPLFARLSGISTAHMTMVLGSPNFSNKYNESNFFKFCEKELSINVINVDMSSRKKDGASIVESIKYKLSYIYRGIRLIPLLFSHNIYIHDYTNILSKTRPLQLIAKLLNKKVFAIPHGLGVQINSGEVKKYNRSDILQMLIFDSDTKETHNKMGYKTLHNIGYVKFYSEWLNLVNSFCLGLAKKPYVVLLSRPIHEQYMDKDKYIFLFNTSIEAINEVFGEIDIIVKMHPREDEDSIRRVLGNPLLNNITFTREYTSVICKNAIASIGFWTSSIIDSATVDTPTIEYYIEADRFRELEVCGSIYPTIGFMSCDNKKELVNFLILIKNNKKIDVSKFLNRVVRNMPSDEKLLNIFTPN